jgi:hypothetical protein
VPKAEVIVAGREIDGLFTFGRSPEKAHACDRKATLDPCGGRRNKSATLPAGLTSSSARCATAAVTAEVSPFAGDLNGRKANLMPFSSNALLIIP